MFDFLKKKISSFTDKLRETLLKKETDSKEQAKPEPEPLQKKEIRAPEPIATEPKKEILEQKEEIEEEPEETGEALSKEEKEFIEEALKPREKEPKKVLQKQEAKTPEKKEKKGFLIFGKKEPEQKPGTPKTPEPKKIEPIEKTEVPEPKPIETTEQEPEQLEEIHEETYDIAGEKKTAEEKISEIRQDEKRELKAKVGLGKKLFGFLGGKVKISEAETKGFFEEFELSLLEADVEQETAIAIVKELKERLIGKEISAKEDITAFLKEQVREALLAVMTIEEGKSGEPKKLLELMGKPSKILFLGPNGAGKTTTIAKIAHYLEKKGKTSIMAAGDTFRAAAIGQLQEHADRLGIKLVKHNYGSDPAAVAFDAVKAAESKGIDFVLIDTAGRQDTNKNLLEELKKIERVIKPDLKIYVGEAYTGQALLQQATEFDKAIGIDGFILTKIDADAKGGTAISLLYTMKKPIFFVGTGQRYDDLLEFKPEFIVDRIL